MRKMYRQDNAEMEERRYRQDNAEWYEYDGRNAGPGARPTLSNNKQ